MRAPHRPPPGVPESIPAFTLPWTLLAGSAILVSFVFFCYWPLTRYFFSQDDFYFLEKASQGLRASMEQHFNARPGHFRPLTKGFYFLGTWPLFGMNPLPYHVVSLVLHALNSILVGALLRRLGVSRVISWVAALLFAANGIHLEAVAWISCVQQLLGATFALSALIWGLDALATRSRVRLILATLAYALALGSYEQTLAVPLLLIAWQWSRHGWRVALRACGGQLFPMLLLLFAYGGYMLGIRGLPGSGPYEMWIGSNVLDNFRQYAGSVFAIWLIYPYVDLPLGLRGSHVVWLVLIGWHLIRGKQRQLAFGCFAFLALLAPVLFMRYHVFGFHLYLPAIGAWYLLAGAADSLVEMLASSWRRPAHVIAACAVVLAASGSVVAVRKNLTNYCSDDVRIPKVRVLRRAVLAEQVCTDVTRGWNGGGRLVLVYAGRLDSGNWGNIQSALGEGRALRLVLGQPTLAVTLALPEQSRDIPPDETMIVTDLGRTFTSSHYQAMLAGRAARP
jgi:hypothetical protein